MLLLNVHLNVLNVVHAFSSSLHLFHKSTLLTDLNTHQLFLEHTNPLSIHVDFFSFEKTFGYFQVPRDFFHFVYDLNSFTVDQIFRF